MVQEGKLTWGSPTSAQNDRTKTQCKEIGFRRNVEGWGGGGLFHGIETYLVRALLRMFGFEARVAHLWARQ